MFLTLIRRELLANLMTFRFSAAMLVCLLLVIANTFVLIDDYKRRLTDYNTFMSQPRAEVVSPDDEKTTYSSMTFFHAYRPPNPLSIFNTGYDKRLGNTVEAHYNFVPTLWDLGWQGSETPFIELLGEIDLIFVFQVVLSLLALLFAYDAIAGEHEQGTLRLLMTTGASRGMILLAKYFSAMVCLILPLIVSLLMAQILILTSGAIRLLSDDWLRIGGIALTSIIYLSAFYLIGMLLSTATRRTATALMLSMFIWVFLVLVYPSMSVFLVNQLWNSRILANSTTREFPAAWAEIKQLWETSQKEWTDFRVNLGLGEDDIFFNMGGDNIGGMMYSVWPVEKETKLIYYPVEIYSMHTVKPNAAEVIPLVCNYFGFAVPLQIKTAEKAWGVRQRTFSDAFIRKAKLSENIQRVSPTAVYDLATQALAGTSRRDIDRFITQAQEYRRTVIQYLHDKKAFSSVQWFIRDRGKASWDDMPEFAYQRADVTTNFKHALPDVLLLVLLNVVLFMATFLIFVRQEI